MRSMRKKMQIIFQDPYSSLNPRFTAGQAIMEPMQVYKLHGSDHSRKEKCMELLKKVGLEESHFYRYPHEFSGDSGSVSVLQGLWPLNLNLSSATNPYQRWMSPFRPRFSIF
jgi:ABC-type microcin C transport system duplicated ATPase subunit YejF